MLHSNFYEQNLGREIIFRCCSCPYDTFSRDSMVGHQTHKHVPVMSSVKSGLRLDGIRVVLGALTWNNENCAVHVADALAYEQMHLRKMGAAVSIFIVDNGSTDATIQTLHRTFENNGADYTIRPECANLGQSVSRNRIIDYALNAQAHYMLMVDGDIAPIPGSCTAMIRELEAAHTEGTGCIGMYSLNCTDETDNTVSPALHCDSVAGLLDYDESIAWTQYGMFRVQMFTDGLRFDEHPVFQGPGWGFEDEDLGLQMMANGWLSANCKHFRYGHYRRNSSLRLLDPALAAKVHAARRSYVASKWSEHSDPRIAQKARQIAHHSFPVLV
jgi:hypothetical protein